MVFLGSLQPLVPILRVNHILPSILLINSHYPLTEKKKNAWIKAVERKGQWEATG